MTDSYCYYRVQAAGNSSQPLAEQLVADTLPAWRGQDVHCWGIWQGLFGLASNELLVMAAADGEVSSSGWRSGLPADVTVVDELSLEPTARPAYLAELEREGLYVFRFFEVLPGDIDEIVELSREAWETFEETERYAARPEGLFRPRDTAGKDSVRMLLVTWYDGFDSWQLSRTPAPEARDNFRRRHALTLSTVAFATRYATP